MNDRPGHPPQKLHSPASHPHRVIHAGYGQVDAVDSGALQELIDILSKPASQSCMQCQGWGIGPGGRTCARCGGKGSLLTTTSRKS